MIKPYIIGISGESGVGKSTMAEIVSLYFGHHNTLIISTDDLHKWERSDAMWNQITHLHPEANNLELGDIHLQNLSRGMHIYRSIYNHSTGSFTPPTKLEPKPYIIVEGLHSFYTDYSKEKIDLKIFINTSEELRIHWKIIRDTEERGYKYNQVLDTIDKRKKDSEIIKKSQISSADIVINIQSKNKITNIGNKSEPIHLQTIIEANEQNDDLLSFINNFICDFDNFVKISEKIGNNIELCQNGGGNISTKISDNYMLIKASGYNIKDIGKLQGYSIINYTTIINNITENTDDDQLHNILCNSVISDKYKKPSMETGFHTILKKYVLHMHPIYVTLILSTDNSKKIIEEIFHDLNYQYVPYITPGLELYRYIEVNHNDIYFLENHGIIITSDDLQLATDLSNNIHYMTKQYVKRLYDFIPFDLSFANLQKNDNYTFPDAVLFSETKKEILAAHNYISIIGPKIGELRYLTPENINLIKNMSAERYRKIV